MNAMGYWLTDSRVGLLFIQVFFFFILSVITFRFLQLGFPRKQSFWLSVILLLGLSFGYNGGNNACEYGMSLLVLSPYLFYKWFQQPTETANGHLYRYSFIYGLTIGLCILTRASNALVVLMILAYVLVHGLTQKRIMSFLLNLITAVTGCLVICLPFVFYFLANDALNDLYDSVIVSNLAFITGLLASLMDLKRAVALFCANVNVLAFVVLGILHQHIVSKTDARPPLVCHGYWLHPLFGLHELLPQLRLHLLPLCHHCPAGAKTPLPRE